jgi:hypothetical protein
MNRESFPEAGQDGAEELEARAASLVNPASGLANDYLNIYNEVVMLIEALPQMPEAIDDILAWRPTTYQDYFAKSILPGSQTALDNYTKLDSSFRKNFEDVVAELDRCATGSVVAIRRHYRQKGAGDPAGLEAICNRGGASLREILQRAVNIVDYGQTHAEEAAQKRADRLLMVRLQAIKDVQDFYSKPRF